MPRACDGLGGSVAPWMASTRSAAFVTFRELRAGGVDCPASVVGEVEITGTRSSASMTADGWSVCACSTRNPAARPSQTRHAGGVAPGRPGRSSRMLPALTSAMPRGRSGISRWGSSGPPMRDASRSIVTMRQPRYGGGEYGSSQ